MVDIYKTNIKPITRQNYLNYWKWYVEDSQIGKMQIGKIKRAYIVELYRELEGKRKLAIGTIKYPNSLLHNCLEDAVADKLLPDNPCDGAIGKIEKEEPQKREALTQEQQALFIDFIANSKIFNIYFPLFLFLLGTGCRIGEATGMRWEDIDLKNNIISVNHTLSYKGIDGKQQFFVTTPKTKNGIREIPIVPDLRRQILRQKEIKFQVGIPNDFEINGYKNFVFTTKTGKPFTQEAVNRVIRDIIEACNKQEIEGDKREQREAIILPRFSAHALRHTFCTRFCENESNVKVIQKIMGHSRIDTTLNIYTHVTSDKANEVMQNLGSKIKIC